MVRRDEDWNEFMLEDLNDPEFTSTFVTHMVETGATLQEAMGDVVRGIGVKEFAASVGMPSSNVARALRKGSNPKLATLERMLKPLGLRIGVAYCDGRRGGLGRGRVLRALRPRLP